MGKFLHHPSKDAASALNVNLTLPAASSSLPVPQLCSRFHPCWTTASRGRTLGTRGAGDWQVAETRTQSGHLQAPRLSTISMGMGAASLGASLQLPPCLPHSGSPSAELVGSPLLPPCPYTQRCTPVPWSGPQNMQETAAAAVPPLWCAGAMQPRSERSLAPPCRALHWIPSGLRVGTKTMNLRET